MKAKQSGSNWFKLGIAFLLVASPTAALADAPKSAQEFAQQYMAAFNKKDSSALEKLRYPTASKSKMAEFIEEMTEAEMKSGTQYNQFEILPVQGKENEPSMGPDGVFYKPSLKPTNVVKLTAVTKDGSSSTSFPVGEKDGIFYAVMPEKDEAATPPYKFGWQRFSLPKSNWSVMLPNEAEPGAQALVKQFGKDALEDPDVYGVVKNTAEIKTCQHFFNCGAEGKRLESDDNKETYRAACTTYTPETLTKYFNDPKKNLDDTVDLRMRSLPGKLVEQKNIELNGAPGRQFEIRGTDGNVQLGRVYWIKDALYELTFDSKLEKPDLDSANKFLSSLEVL